MALLGRARTASGKQPDPGKSERTLRKGGLTNRAEDGGRAEANGGAVPQGSLLPGGSAGAKPGAAVKPGAVKTAGGIGWGTDTGTGNRPVRKPEEREKRPGNPKKTPAPEEPAQPWGALLHNPGGQQLPNGDRIYPGIGLAPNRTSAPMAVLNVGGEAAYDAVRQIADRVDFRDWDRKTTTQQRNALRNTGLRPEEQWAILNTDGRFVETLAVISEIRQGPGAYGLTNREAETFYKELVKLEQARLEAEARRGVTPRERQEETRYLEERKKALLERIGYDGKTGGIGGAGRGVYNGDRSANPSGRNGGKTAEAREALQESGYMRLPGYTTDWQETLRQTIREMALNASPNYERMSFFGEYDKAEAPEYDVHQESAWKAYDEWKQDQAEASRFRKIADSGVAGKMEAEARAAQAAADERWTAYAEIPVQLTEATLQNPYAKRYQSLLEKRALTTGEEAAATRAAVQSLTQAPQSGKLNKEQKRQANAVKGALLAKTKEFAAFRTLLCEATPFGEFPYQFVASVGSEKNDQLQYLRSSEMVEMNHPQIMQAAAALDDIRTIVGLLKGVDQGVFNTIADAIDYIVKKKPWEATGFAADQLHRREW